MNDIVVQSHTGVLLLWIKCHIFGFEKTCLKWNKDKVRSINYYCITKFLLYFNF